MQETVINNQYSWDLSDTFLSEDEKKLFDDYLEYHGLDRNIWPVFLHLFQATTKYTKPLVLRSYDNQGLAGAAIIIQCRKFGQALFSNPILNKLVDSLQIRCHLWIRFGCCMDMMSNPGFIREPQRADEVLTGMVNFLKRKKLLTIVNDYTQNADLYKQATELPALPHALIDCSAMVSISDYTNTFKNIKRKIRVFRNKGGQYKIVQNQLKNEQLDELKKCFISTVEKSVFYLPYQDLYLESAVHTSKHVIDSVYYFIATLNGHFLGYQAALQTGHHLNTLHGAFNRTRKTTFHAYDILFVKMIEFAIENDLKIIDFGAVINQTKAKMINTSKEMSYFILSRYSLIQTIFKLMLKTTKIQGSKQMKFRQNG